MHISSSFQVSSHMAPRIAVLLPCYNEAATIAQVIAAFRLSLPSAQVYVFDNASSDVSAAIARESGAIVVDVPIRGKGNVVRRMFADVDADVYVMADADLTYDSRRAAELIAPILTGEVDTVIATRTGGDGAYPDGHRFGNRLFNVLVARVFGQGLNDIFSGYRAFSRRFVAAFPAHSRGFEIETELSVFMLEQRIPYREIAMDYGARPAGSHSKLHTWRDGIKILLMVVRLFKDTRPLLFFGLTAMMLTVMGLLLGVPVIIEWQEQGHVVAVAKAVLAMGMVVLAGLSLLSGVLLDAVARAAREARRGRYLAVARTVWPVG